MTKEDLVLAILVVIVYVIDIILYTTEIIDGFLFLGLIIYTGVCLLLLKGGAD